MYFPFLMNYAEIHYRIPFLKARYDQNAPEIIFDAPVRCFLNKTKTFPIAIIVKDAHLFPVEIFDIKINFNTGYCTSLDFQEQINQPFYHQCFEIPITEEFFNRQIQFEIHFKYSIIKSKKTKVYSCINDNYKGLPAHHFSCFFHKDKDCIPESFWKGEPHYHSNYTNDQVEFGAPLSITKRFAQCMGIDWLFVTDHSYDLDDSLTDYLKNDPLIPKWKLLEDEIDQLSDDSVKILRGEELSVGNHLHQNVHLLLINHSHFYEGKGDSAEVWFKNKPDHTLKEISRDLSEDKSIIIAAHPFEKVPLMQKWTLNRGEWSLKDYKDNEIQFLQAINQSSIAELISLIHQWVLLLLNQHRLYLIAGNDAHGNFQWMKQIKIPFIKLFLSKNQIFAGFFTIFRSKINDPISGFNSKYLIVSNGPFLDFQVEKDEIYHIGDHIEVGKYILKYQFNSNIEYGECKTLKLFIGSIDKKKEICILNPKQNIELDLREKGYIRMECLTENQKMAITNPIWINQLQESNSK